MLIDENDLKNIRAKNVKIAEQQIDNTIKTTDFYANSFVKVNKRLEQESESFRGF